mmetsp:Transcript_45384/g.150491  ORF Transcript_45384/g.150491 Transcript_45384/m.150491 type:complete len:216 (+) Transcript_45384:994-1641(+)
MRRPCTRGSRRWRRRARATRESHPRSSSSCSRRRPTCRRPSSCRARPPRPSRRRARGPQRRGARRWWPSSTPAATLISSCREPSRAIWSPVWTRSPIALRRATSAKRRRRANSRTSSTRPRAGSAGRTCGNAARRSSGSSGLRCEGRTWRRWSRRWRARSSPRHGPRPRRRRQVAAAACKASRAPLGSAGRTGASSNGIRTANGATACASTARAS